MTSTTTGGARERGGDMPTHHAEGWVLLAVREDAAETAAPLVFNGVR